MAELDFIDQTFVNFRDHPVPEGRPHGARWVDLRSFRIPPGKQDADLLAAVVAHEQFRDDYAGGGIDPGGTRHGPYWLRAVNPSDYQPATRTETAQTLRQWANQYGGLPDWLQATLEETLFAAVDSASRLYRLRNLGRPALHDRGSVHVEFLEFVAVNDERKELLLLVAGDN